MGLEQIRKLKEEANNPKEKKVYRIPKQSAKKIAQNSANKELRAAGGKTEQEKWYEKIMLREPGRCWETLQPINKNDKAGWHGSIAHILPKNNFPSVATHPLNYLILAMWGGVHDKTHRWDTFQKMKVWPMALSRIEMMYPELTTQEIRRLPDSVMQYLESMEPF